MWYKNKNRKRKKEGKVRVFGEITRGLLFLLRGK